MPAQFDLAPGLSRVFDRLTRVNPVRTDILPLHRATDEGWQGFWLTASQVGGEEMVAARERLDEIYVIRANFKRDKLDDRESMLAYKSQARV